MKTRLPGLMSLLFLLLTANVRAGTPLPVHFTASVSPSPARIGEVVTVTVHAAIDPGWHIYSVVPAATGPATTAITSWNGAEAVSPTTENAPIHKFDPNFQTPVAYHEGAATFQRQFRLTGTAGKSVTLHYQTCNDHVCLPPTDVALPVSLQVAPGAARSGSAPPAPNPGGAGEGTPGGGQSIASAAASSSASALSAQAPPKLGAGGGPAFPCSCWPPWGRGCWR